MIKHFPWKRKPWIFQWRDQLSGKTRTRSFVSEEEARTFERVHSELAQKEKELMARARRKAKAAQPNYTVNELLDLYVNRPEVLETTRTSIMYHSRSIREILGTRKVSAISGEEIKAYVAVLQARGLMLSTVHRRLTILRAACSWAVRENLLRASPLTNVRLPQAKSRRIDPPSVVELDRLMAVAPPLLKRVILLGLYTGARIGPSELFRLSWADVDLRGGIIYMPCSYKADTPEYRFIPVHKNLLPEIRNWRKEDSADCLWVIHKQGRKVQSVSDAWHKACAEAGIVRKIRPYDLRHAFASFTMANGGDIRSVAEMMGHKNIQMLLKVYQHVNTVLKRKAVNGIPILASLKEKERKKQ
ncbi:MAG: site-specific integrase [Mailhella sp.]|nr:site-specific integrase [Mailhella sp.]